MSHHRFDSENSNNARGHLSSREALSTGGKILVLACSFLLLSACSGTRPAYLGSVQSELPLCPSKPNCVSSNPQEDEDHAISAFSISDKASAHQKLTQAIEQTPSARIIVNDPSYIYAEYESDLMGFVDDLELLFSNDKVDVRSASRLGYSDWGVNRERVEALRSALNN